MQQEGHSWERVVWWSEDGFGRAPAIIQDAYQEGLRGTTDPEARCPTSGGRFTITIPESRAGGGALPSWARLARVGGIRAFRDPNDVEEGEESRAATTTGIDLPQYPRLAEPPEDPAGRRT